MISDICSALLSNPAINSDFCLAYLNKDEAELEAYQFEHRREIGSNYDPMAKQKHAKKIHAIHFYVACILIVTINLCAWTIVRYRTRKEAQARTRALVNQRIQSYLELNTTEREVSRQNRA